MKRITNSIFLFAATAAFLGTAAYGQNTVKANVPFAFRVPGGGESAGSYVVRLENMGSGKSVQFFNAATKRSMLTMSYRLSGKFGEEIKPRLVFRCGEAGCALSEIWTREAGYGVAVGRVRAHEYLASIPLTKEQGD